jgi:hypothetical protein
VKLQQVFLIHFSLFAPEIDSSIKFKRITTSLAMCWFVVYRLAVDGVTLVADSSLKIAKL